MKNTWFFGCSFIAGYGIDYDWYRLDNGYEPTFNIGDGLLIFKGIGVKYENSSYSKKLAKHNKTGIKMYAFPGVGYEYIIDKLWEQIINIKSGDYVILGHTISTRRIYFDNNKSRFTGQVWWNPIKKSMIFSAEDVSIPMYEEEIESIKNHHLNTLIRNEDLYIDYYTKIYENIANYLESIGAIVNIIHTNMWYNVVAENIETWTAREPRLEVVRDFHWSPQGHDVIFKAVCEARKRGVRNIKREWWENLKV